MKQPNFFIIGAPKCGTSTLINKLRWHPNIYVPLDFEPQYFCTDFQAIADYTPAKYMALFDSATDQQTAIGEKSVIYLYSENAVDNILEFDPSARLIVMLRNPIDLVYSWHSQLYYSFIEHIEDFATAWSMQESRQSGENIGDRCPVPFALQYREIGLLGKYLRKLLDTVPREQLKIVFMEDFHADSDRVYRDTLDFLDIPYAPTKDARRMNANKRHRYRWLGELLAHDTETLASRAVKRFDRLPGIRKLHVKYRLHEFNKIEYQRPPLTQELRAMLADEFRDDIGELAELTGRDLAHWVQPASY